MKNVSTLTELCTTSNIDYGNIMAEMLRFTKQTVADHDALSSDPTELRLLHVEQFMHLAIPLADFHKIHFVQIHRARSTGPIASLSGGPRTDWAWIQAGGDVSYGDLPGRGVA